MQSELTEGGEKKTPDYAATLDILDQAENPRLCKKKKKKKNGDIKIKKNITTSN